MADSLAGDAAKLGVALSGAAAQALHDYLDLLRRWNRVVNLTAITQPDQMIVRHVLDSLACLPHLRGARILDVGSGAGLPGLVLAIADPRLDCMLVEPRQKRSRFLEQVRIELKLANVKTAACRVEDLPAPHDFTTVISRAFAAMPGLIETTRRWQLTGVRHCVMAGQFPAVEVAQLSSAGHAPQVIPLSIPGLSEPRHLLIVDS